MKVNTRYKKDLNNIKKNYEQYIARVYKFFTFLLKIAKKSKGLLMGRHIKSDIKTHRLVLNSGQ